jgi:DNA (cytosine-5)-methyltransferase 1
MRPLALDLFCKAGGASMGLHRAGFDVIGVDIEPQPRYPFTFVQADALRPPFDLTRFAFIWSSPPCQAYTVSRTRAKVRKEHPDLVAPVREMLTAAGVPFVIENVPGAPLQTGIMLCGSMFGLGAIGDDGVWRQLARHRYFETSWPMLSPPCNCDSREKIGVYGNGGGWSNRYDPNRRGYKGNVREARDALGMPWATIAELSQAIPPAYSEFIGRAALSCRSKRTAA